MPLHLHVPLPLHLHLYVHLYVHLVSQAEARVAAGVQVQVQTRTKTLRTLPCVSECALASARGPGLLRSSVKRQPTKEKALARAVQQWASASGGRSQEGVEVVDAE